MPFRSMELSPVEARLGARLLESVSVVVDWVHARPVGVAADPVERALSLDELSAEALARIEAIEVAKARLEGELVEAYGALHTIIGEQFGLRREGFGKVVPISADQVAVKEIAGATGVGEAEVSRRMRLATQPRRHRVVREALKAGRVGLYRATQFVSECAEVDDAAQPALEEVALEPPRGGGMRSQRSFTGRLRRLVKGADTRGAGERRAAARRSRTAYGRVGDDGMGSLTLIADAERIAAILARADAVARTLRSQGDPRTLEQLRSDFIGDALLFGWPRPRTGCGPATEGGPAAAASDAWAGMGDSGHDVPTSGECGDCGDFDPGRASRVDPSEGTDSDSGGETKADPSSPATGPPGDEVPPFEPGSWLGRPPPANVWIIVPFEVAAGLSDAPCELPGHGWVTSEHARAIITAPGSVWHQLSVDVDTGAAVHLGSRGYRPSAELIAQVRARDGVCRGPGCDVPADRCDLDHEVPWPEGATRYINLYAKHRFCHMARTARLWRSEPSGDGALRWTTLTGRDYLTYPKDWLEGLREHEHLAEHEHPAEQGAAAPGVATPQEGHDCTGPAPATSGDPADDGVATPDATEAAGMPPGDPPPF